MAYDGFKAIRPSYFLLLIIALMLGFIAMMSGMAAAGNSVSVDLEIRERAVTLEDKTLKVSEGDKVILNWRTDEKADLHLHGYDLNAQAVPGEVTVMTIDADTAGRFPVTAHNFGHETLVYLEIHPR